MAEIEKIAGAPHYITQTGVFYLFVADLYKHHQLLQQANLPSAGLSNMEALLVSVVDTTIAAQNMAAFAETQGLGICYIGGIRNDLFRIAELTELPPYTLPLFGLTIGYPATKNEPKVRLPQSAVLSVDHYQPLTEDLVARYNETTADYYAHRRSNQQKTDWQNQNDWLFPRTSPSGRRKIFEKARLFDTVSTKTSTCSLLSVARLSPSKKHLMKKFFMRCFELFYFAKR